MADHSPSYRASSSRDSSHRGRTIAIGDIHGCDAALAALLEAVNPQPEDVVVTLGDYVDRGPNTRGVIDQLLGLTTRCQLVPLQGNHEIMMLQAVAVGSGHPMDFWMECGGRATLASYGDSLHEIPEAHLRFLQSCRYFHTTERHAFIHANYYPELPWEDQPPFMAQWESLQSTTPGPHESGKTVLVGHTSQRTGEVLHLGHLICVDTYCYGGGWLTAYEVHTGEIWQANRNGVLRQSPL